MPSSRCAIFAATFLLACYASFSASQEADTNAAATASGGADSETAAATDYVPDAVIEADAVTEADAPASFPVAREVSFLARNLVPHLSLNRSMFTRQEDLGISYLMVPYSLHQANNAAPEDAEDAGNGNFHVWLKFIAAPPATDGSSGSMLVRSFFFFESAGNPYNPRPGMEQQDMHLRNPQGLYVHPPSFQLQSIDRDGRPSGPAIDLEHLPAVDQDRPWWLQGSLPGGTRLPDVMQLVIGNGHRPAPFMPRLTQPPSAADDDPVADQLPLNQVQQRRAVEQGRELLQEVEKGKKEEEAGRATLPPTFHICLGTTRLPPTEAVPLLLRHIAHHRPLGFESWLVYVRERWMGFMSAVRNQLDEYMDEGLLQLMDWHGPLPWANGEVHEYDQPLAYNHALLAFSGRNAYVALVQYDEYLVLRAPGQGVRGAHSSCMESASVACVPQHSFACKHCPGEASILNYKLTHPDGTEEVRILNGKRLPDAMCRNIVDADKAYAWETFDGQLMPGVEEEEGARVTVEDETCGSWVKVDSRPDIGTISMEPPEPEETAKLLTHARQRS